VLLHRESLQCEHLNRDHLQVVGSLNKKLFRFNELLCVRSCALAAVSAAHQSVRRIEELFFFLFFYFSSLFADASRSKRRRTRRTADVCAAAAFIFFFLISGRPQCHSGHPVGNTLTPPTTTKIREKCYIFTIISPDTPQPRIQSNSSLLLSFLSNLHIRSVHAYTYSSFYRASSSLFKRLSAIPRRHLMSNLVQHLHLIVF